MEVVYNHKQQPCHQTKEKGQYIHKENSSNEAWQWGTKLRQEKRLPHWTRNKNNLFFVVEGTSCIIISWLINVPSQ